MTKRDPRELQFEAVVRASGNARRFDLSKPYMREADPGYDSAFTNHLFWGFCMGLDAAAGPPAAPME